MRTQTRSADSIFVPCTAFRLLVFTAAFLVIGRAEAQWSFEPQLQVGVERDDNATLSTRTDDVLDVTGVLYGGEIRADYQSNVTNFFFTPRVISRNYDDAPEIDSDDWFVDSLYRRRLNNSLISFRLDYEDQSARTAERADTDLDTEDPGDIPEDGVGGVRLEGRRERVRLRPEWNYDFNTVSSMNLFVNYLETIYDGEIEAALQDFSDARFGASYNRAFTERTVGTILGTVRRYTVSDSDVETDGIGIMAGIETRLTETTRARAMIGLEDTDSTVSETDPEIVADFSLRRRGQTVNTLAQYRRTISASGSGLLAVRDSLNLNLSRRLSELVTAGIGVRAYQTSSLDEFAPVNERDYVQLRAQVVWNISRAFAAEVDYRYTFQKRQSLAESANSNQVTVWFVYRPNYVDRRFRDELDL